MGGGVYHIKLGTSDANELQKKSPMLQQKNVTPQVSLTAPNRDHFVPVSLTFLDAITKAKKLIRLSIAQDLMPVSLTKSFLALAMAFNLLLSNLTAIAKAKKPLCQ